MLHTPPRDAPDSSTDEAIDEDALKARSAERSQPAAAPPAAAAQPATQAAVRPSDATESEPPAKRPRIDSAVGSKTDNELRAALQQLGLETSGERGSLLERLQVALDDPIELPPGLSGSAPELAAVDDGSEAGDRSSIGGGAATDEAPSSSGVAAADEAASSTGGSGWACASCTYLHLGAQAIFLTCAICGEQRPGSHAATDPHASSPTAGGSTAAPGSSSGAGQSSSDAGPSSSDATGSSSAAGRGRC